MKGRLVFVLCILTSWAFADDTCENPVISGPPIFPPYIVPIDDNTSGGIAVERAMELLTPVVGEPVLDQTKPWPRVLKEFEQGVIDILFVVLYDPDRESFARYTDSWFSDDYGVVTYETSDLDFGSVSSLDGLRGGYYYGVYLPEPYGSYVKDNPNVAGIKEVESMYKMLALNRVNYLVVALETFKLLRPESFEESNFIVHDSSITSIPVHMAVSKNSPCIELFDAINEAVVPAL